MDDEGEVRAVLTRAVDATGELPTPPVPDPRPRYSRRQRRIAVLASAGAVLVAVVAVVVLRPSNASNPDAAVPSPSSPAPIGGRSSPPANASPVGVAALARYRWHTLPPAPITARSQAAGVWTGHDLLVWGGSTSTTSYADGASYDPAQRTWTRLPAAPHRRSLSSRVRVDRRGAVRVGRRTCRQPSQQPTAPCTTRPRTAGPRCRPHRSDPTAGRGPMSSGRA